MSAEVIKAARVAARLTQQEVAERVGVSIAAVRSWEGPRGSIPRGDVASRLAKLLGTTVHQLCGKEDAPRFVNELERAHGLAFSIETALDVAAYSEAQAKEKIQEALDSTIDLLALLNQLRKA